MVLPIPRVECQAWGAVRQVEISFADARRSYTSSFERSALELGRRMTIRDVAKHLDVSWDVMKKVLKGTRWLLLKAAENLDEKRDEKKALEEALALNKSLAVAYYLKEDLRRFREQPGKRFATVFLDGWIKRAEGSGIKVLQVMARTLAGHRSGLLTDYEVMLTSGPMAGTNNRIKTMKRQA